MRALGILCVLLAAGVLPGAAQGMEDIPLRGFGFTRELLLSGSPREVFDALTGDLTPWWDHTFAKPPVALYIEPKAGGCFCEIMDTAGAAVRHAVVTSAVPGRLLRFEGALGLAGAALTMVHTYELAARGDSTVLTLKVRGFGEVQESWPALVQQVWEHFLVERFQPYYEGRRRAVRQ
jgi:hypothetical protein